MDEKIKISATENAENTAQAEQTAATAQSGAQDGTATEAVTQSKPPRRMVLLPYKFTLLSNLKFGKATLLAVYLQGRNYNYNITFFIVSQLYNT